MTAGSRRVARSREIGSICPDCGEPSRRVHSRYERCLSDLPAHGRRVRIKLTVRRFRCGNDRCPRVIFAERFGDDIVAPYARRTARLQTIVHHLGLALGGRPGQGLARRLLMPVSKDTLLRVVRARAPAAKPACAGDRHRRLGLEARASLRHASSATWSGARSSTFFPTARPPRSRPGWRIIPPSRSSRATAAAATARPLPAPLRRRRRSPTAGT